MCSLRGPFYGAVSYRSMIRSDPILFQKVSYRIVSGTDAILVGLQKVSYRIVSGTNLILLGLNCVAHGAYSMEVSVLFSGLFFSFISGLFFSFFSSPMPFLGFSLVFLMFVVSWWAGRPACWPASHPARGGCTIFGFIFQFSVGFIFQFSCANPWTFLGFPYACS